MPNAPSDDTSTYDSSSLASSTNGSEGDDIAQRVVQSGKRRRSSSTDHASHDSVHNNGVELFESHGGEAEGPTAHVGNKRRYHQKSDAEREASM